MEAEAGEGLMMISYMAVSKQLCFKGLQGLRGLDRDYVAGEKDFWMAWIQY